MEVNYEHIRNFLHACDELVGGTYHDADTEISDALRAVAASKELTNLFGAVTARYDYPAAKRAYLRPTSDDANGRGCAFLPTARNEILAFVFCLFVELDEGVMHLNDFLLRYFYVDGSYTASYALFADRMIRPFRDIVRDCYPDCGKRGQFERIARLRDEKIGEIACKLPEEKGRLAGIALREEERADAEKLFAALIAAAGRRDAENLVSLLTGYKYFLKYINDGGEGAAPLFAAAAELEKL